MPELAEELQALLTMKIEVLTNTDYQGSNT